MNPKSKEKRIIIASIILGAILLLNVTLLYLPKEPFDKSSKDLGLGYGLSLISDNGKKIVYQEYDDEGYVSAMYLLDNDGSNKSKILESPGNDSSMGCKSLSEGGELMVFSILWLNNNTEEIRIINTTTKIQNHLYSYTLSNATFDYIGARGMWLSSSEKELIFTIQGEIRVDPVGYNGDIESTLSKFYKVNLDTYNVTFMFEVDKGLWDIDYNPLNDKICFCSGDAIYLINSDGTGLTQIISIVYLNGYGPYRDYSDPNFSPDGNKIVYSKHTAILSSTDISEIFIINLDGSDNTKIFGGKMGESIWEVTFTPDNEIVFIYDLKFYQLDYDDGKLSNMQLLENMNKLSLIIAVACASGLVIIVLKDARKSQKKNHPQKKGNPPPPQP